MKQINKMKCHSKPRPLLFGRAPESFCPGSDCNNLESSTLSVSQRSQQALKMPNQVQHDGSFYTRGFTLIELLVVVLIIGILAAVALPQYQLAVAKSRIMGHFPLVKNLIESENVYFLANGRYTYDFNDLDTEVSSVCPARAGTNEVYDCPHNLGFMLSPQGQSYDGKTNQVLLRYCTHPWCTISSGNTIAVLSFDTPTGQLFACTGVTSFGQKLCKIINVD